LQEQNDVFVYVELLGQRKRTQAMPPVFPFLFHEKVSEPSFISILCCLLI